MFNNYPYTDTHELNLDWILKKMKELKIEFDEFKVINQISFSGAWDITKQYPAWTIVSDNNIGYVSIKPVPAGVLLTNGDYWREVIDYSAQIAGLQSRVVALEGQMLTAQSDIAALNATSQKTYDTVADMITGDPALDTVVYCNGYNTKTDGGGAHYIINNVSDAYSITINVGKYAHLNEYEVHPQQFGCVCYAGIDDYAAFAKACDYSAWARRTLMLTRSLEIDGTIELKNYMSIVAESQDVYIKQLGANDTFYFDGSATLWYVTLRGFKIDGNSKTGTRGIHFKDAGSYYNLDNVDIADLQITQMANEGIRFGNMSLVGHAHNIIIDNCGGIGLYVGCSDGRFEDINIWACMSSFGGLYVAGGVNKFSNVKIYLIGDSSNTFRCATITGSANAFSNLEVQDVHGYGIWLTGNYNTFSNFSASNIYEYSGAQQALRIEGGTNTIVSGVVRLGSATGNLIGVRGNGTVTGTNIILSSDVTNPVLGFNWTTSYGVVNGVVQS